MTFCNLQKNAILLKGQVIITKLIVLDFFLSFSTNQFSQLAFLFCIMYMSSTSDQDKLLYFFLASYCIFTLTYSYVVSVTTLRLAGLHSCWNCHSIIKVQLQNRNGKPTSQNTASNPLSYTLCFILGYIFFYLVIASLP